MDRSQDRQKLSAHQSELIQHDCQIDVYRILDREMSRLPNESLIRGGDQYVYLCVVVALWLDLFGVWTVLDSLFSAVCHVSRCGQPSVRGDALAVPPGLRPPLRVPAPQDLEVSPSQMCWTFTSLINTVYRHDNPLSLRVSTTGRLTPLHSLKIIYSHSYQVQIFLNLLHFHYSFWLVTKSESEKIWIWSNCVIYQWG